MIEIKVDKGKVDCSTVGGLGDIIAETIIAVRSVYDNITEINPLVAEVFKEKIKEHLFNDELFKRGSKNEESSPIYPEHKRHRRH
jgi:hypothetical protein